MSAHVTSFIAELDKQRRALNSLAGKQVHSAKIRNDLRKLAEHYFSDVRPMLVDRSEDDEHIGAVNSAMQRLVEMCHKRGMASSYKELLRISKSHLIHLDSALLSSELMGNGGSEVRTPVDTKIVTTLRALQPGAALSYEQALQDLSQAERLSWRGPATDLREALRETLDRLAPDSEVTEAVGYKPEPGAGGPTMKQKVRFILRNRNKSKSLSATTEDATKSVDEAIGSFVRSVYTRSSVSTHTPTDKNEVLRVLDLVRVVLCELLEVR